MRRVIEIARRFDVLGWKVNGAGGDGGSLTVLCGEEAGQKWEMAEAIEKVNAAFKVIPIRLDNKGLFVSKEG